MTATSVSRATCAFIPSLARSVSSAPFAPSLFIRPMTSSTRPSPPPSNTNKNNPAVLRQSPTSSSSSEQPLPEDSTLSPSPPLSTSSSNGTSNAISNGASNGASNGTSNGTVMTKQTTATTIAVDVADDDDDDDDLYYVDECEETYRLPPPEIAQLVDAPTDPSVSLQPAEKEWMILLDKPNLPPIAEVASEELRLAGFRINATTYVPSRADYFIGLTLQRVDDPQRRQIPITGLPTSSPSSSSTNDSSDYMLHFGYVRWSPDGKRFAFCVYDPLFGLQLWMVDISTCHAENLLPNIRLNAVCGDPFTWSADSKTLVAKFVIEDRKLPSKPSVPRGPVIQENFSNAPAPSRTFQDLLQSRHDRRLFEHYTSCRLGLVNIDTKFIQYIGPKSAAFRRASPSPDGKFLLVDMMIPPFAYMMPAGRFPRKVEVWNAYTGELVTQVAEIPLQDKIPIAFDGVGEGPRGIGWRSDANATLYWAEAQDGGDPNKDAEIRDCIYTLAAPFKGSPRKLASLQWRYSGLVWGSNSVALLSERRYKSRSAKAYLIAPGPANDDENDIVNNSNSKEEFIQGPVCERACDINQGEAPKRLIFNVSNWEDRYSDRGSVCTTRDERGKTVLSLIYPSGRHEDDDKEEGSIGRPFFILQGSGASDEGDRPFLSLFDTVTEESILLWRSEPPKFQSIVMVLEEDEDTGAPLKVLIRQEDQKENPNFYIVDMSQESKEAFSKLMTSASLQKHSTTKDGDGKAQQQQDDENTVVGKNNILYPLTTFPHPAPELVGVQREIVNYERADGVRLNASLYLPSGYNAEKDGPLPVFMWAYPREFKSAEFAGQMKGSPYRFVRLARTPLYWLTRGYAILDGPEMPIIGEGDIEGNDTYIEQLVLSAEAAVNFLIERGIGEKGRMAIGGHSYGAFMTVNLLAHAPQLFCCGVARSGAYNRTLTPFGFQSEERSLWEARNVYVAMSPYMFADKIQVPLLLIHGDADNNPGTFPLQSERLFQALKGHGKICRYVNLPHEGHGYRARESVMHVLAEMTMFLDKYCNGVDDNFMSVL